MRHAPHLPTCPRPSPAHVHDDSEQRVLRLCPRGLVHGVAEPQVEGEDHAVRQLLVAAQLLDVLEALEVEGEHAGGDLDAHALLSLLEAGQGEGRKRGGDGIPMVIGDPRLSAGVATASYESAQQGEGLDAHALLSLLKDEKTTRRVGSPPEGGDKDGT